MSAGPGMESVRLSAENLETLYRNLAARRKSGGKPSYQVPSRWSDPSLPPTTIVVNPFEYYSQIIESLAGLAKIWYATLRVMVGRRGSGAAPRWSTT